MSLVVNLFRYIFGNSFARSEPTVNNNNVESVMIVPSQVQKRTRDDENIEVTSPKRRKLISETYIKSGFSTVGSLKLESSSKNRLYSKPSAIIDLTDDKPKDTVNRRPIYSLDDDEDDRTENIRPFLSTGKKSYNVLREVNGSSRLNLIQPRTILTRSEALCKPNRRAAYIVDRVFLEKDTATLYDMMRKEAGASAHRKNTKTSKMSSPASKTSTSKPCDTNMVKSSISHRFFTRNLLPSAPTKYLPENDVLSNKTVIDLTKDEEDDVSQRQTIEANVRSSERIRNLKSNFVAKDVAAADPQFLDKIVQKHKQKFLEAKAATERVKKDIRKNEEEVNNKLSEILDRRLSLKESSRKEEQRPSYEIAPITPEMNATINSIIASRKQTLIQIKDTGVKIQDIRTLNNGAWLNDEIINAYMNLIKLRSETSPNNYPKVHCFNTFLYEQLQKKGYSSVRRWTKRVDIFDFMIIIVPIHLGSHWCLIEMRMKEKIILYYDSLGSPNNRCLEAMLQYLVDEHQDKKNQLLDSTEWKLTNVLPDDIPRQKNAYDCGVFACTYAEHLTRLAPLNFDQEHMPYFRTKMTYEILTGSLIL